jgi:hypothetical protein
MRIGRRVLKYMPWNGGRSYRQFGWYISMVVIIIIQAKYVAGGKKIMKKISSVLCIVLSECRVCTYE